MHSKTALQIIGIGLILQGIIFYVLAKPLTLQIFPNASEEAVHVGMIMRRGLATISFLAGLVVFLVRNDENRTTKRVLFGCGIGFASISLSMIKIFIENDAAIPVPAMLLYSFVSIYSFYLAMRTNNQ